MRVSWDAKVQVSRYSPVGEVEGLGARPAVDLRFDPLGVGVGGQLLTGVAGEQEEGIVLGVGHLELVSAQRADFFGGGVRLHQQGLGGAARVRLLEGDAEIVLRGEDGVWDEWRLC